MDLTALLESNATAFGVLLVVLFCLITGRGITLSVRVDDLKQALAEEKERADEAEAARREDRREHTATVTRLADEVSSSRRESAQLHSDVKTAIRTSDQLRKQVAQAITRKALPPIEEPEEGSWDS